MTGRLGEAGAFERGEMERQGGGGNAKARGDVTGRKAIWAFRQQKPHQVEPGFLGEGTESGSGCS